MGFFGGALPKRLHQNTVLPIGLAWCGPLKHRARP